MSRIFDALRQSERDKQPGSENWSHLPGAPTTEEDVSGGDEALRDFDFHVGPDENPYGLASLTTSPIVQSGYGGKGEFVPSVAPDDPSTFPPAGSARPVATVQKLLADMLSSAGESSPAPFLGTGESLQLDLSELKVIPEASIQSPFLVALNRERELGAEKFRVLGARLSNIRLGATLKVLQVTSSVVGEGKTLTSVNLAMTLAKRFAQKVVLVEGDLRKPAVCTMLGLTNRLGIGDWWQEEDAPISDFMLRIGDTGMCLLPAGNAVHPASVLQSQRLPDMLAGLTRVFDWVIIDTPPLLPMADSNQWSRIADGTLFVVRKGAVSRAALKKAVESIDNPKLVGIVLNDASDYDRVNYYDQYSTPRVDGDAAQRKEVTR